MAELSDADALSGLELNSVWKPDTSYPLGKRLRYGDKLYRVEQPHTSSSIYLPGAIGTEALYSEVAQPGQGDTKDNPIPYSGNMQLYNGKYYSQDNIVYICTRDSGIPLSNPLSALVGLYVEIAQ